MQYKIGNTILKCENLSVTLGGRQIITDINFEIKDFIRPDVSQGQILALCGRSGVGKSTLFNALSGLYSLNYPNTGSVALIKPNGSVNDALLPVKVGDMGVVYQDYFMYPHRRLKKIFLMSVAKNKNIAENDREQAIMEVAKEFEITASLDKFPGELSGGQKQRAAIAEQLLNGGHFLLLDEPFSGLDVKMIKKVVELLIKVSLTDEIKTLIIVSHDLVNSVAISDTVFLLNHKDNDPSKAATIIKKIDLIERDLAWHTHVKETKAFQDTIEEIESLL